MRSQRGSGYSSSRYEQRRSRTDRLLGWIIGMVSLLILVVGCIILISVFHTSSETNQASSSNTHSQSSTTNNSKSQESKSDKSSSSSSISDSSQVSNDDSSTASSADSSSSSQSDENHQASYEMGSADWNAQVAAISEATGIEEESMTIRWLGNGGTPNSSLARVAPKDNQNAIYVVHLVYKNGHWQADDVKKP
ncbi:YrrS family protein [Sporolactobacillus sp. CPB3-1]|uniref:YrrS family protein n=1 Tax=Sporolactobacillus mangiferae TaxID=2940498 RepID=A0ABT0M6H1_9BACL|nr:YrrS family protein [Sporolactobacillus mangiferae]MCL1630456.1 YrrS family protein [Sporolactobacillus mangiferae]